MRGQARRSTLLRMGLAAVLGFSWVRVTCAQTAPSLMNFQGRLTDSSNNPLTGSHNLTFQIFDAAAAGNSLWGPETQALTVSNGVFAAQLGAVVPLTAPVLSGSTAYLQVTVDGTPMNPRTQLITSPYAFNAQLVSGHTYQFFVSTDNATQSIAGNKTFTGTLTVPTPTLPGHAATKAYVDAQATGASGWTLAGSVTELTSPAQNVVVQSTLTVQGNAFSVAGATLVVNAGQVGIGTSGPLSPSAPLTVQGAGSTRLDVLGNPVGNNNAQLSLLPNGTGGSFLYYGNNLSFEASPSNAVTLTVQNGGNVGVGTTSPLSALDVNGGVTYRSSATWTGMPVPPVSAAGQGAIYFDSTANQFYVSQNGGAYAALATSGGQVVKTGDFMTGPLTMLSGSTITVAGNAFSVGGSTLAVKAGQVGIGTSAPSDLLTVFSNASNASVGATVSNPSASASNTYLQLKGDAAQGFTEMDNNNSGTANSSLLDIPSAGMLRTGNGATGGLSIFTQAAGAPLRLGTGGFSSGNERMRVAGSGNVGIGTTGPAAALDVNGGLIVRSSITWVGISAPPPSANGSAAMYFDSGLGQLMVSQTGGAYQSLGTAANAVSKAGDFMTGPLTLQGSTLTVTGNAFSVGGSTLAASGGRVGVGTTAPAALLHVSGGDLQVSGAGGANASTISASGFVTLAGLPSSPAGSPGRIYYSSTAVGGMGALMVALNTGAYVPISTGIAAGGISAVAVNASEFSGDGTLGNPLTLQSSSATMQGNAFNGAGQLLQLNGSGQIPSSALPAAAAGEPYVLRAGDGMTGGLTLLSGSTLTVTGNAFSVGGSTLAVLYGNVGLGTTSPANRLDVNGGAILRSSATWAGMAAPSVSAAGQGAIYFDSTANQFLASQNGGAYSSLVSGWTPSGNTITSAAGASVVVPGSAFSVGGSTFAVQGGSVVIGPFTLGASTFSPAGFLAMANLGGSGQGPAPMGAPGRIYYDSTQRNNNGALMVALNNGVFVPITTGTATGGISGWSLANNNLYPTSPGISVTLFSTLTVQGSQFSVGGALNVAAGGASANVQASSLTLQGSNIVTAQGNVFQVINSTNVLTISNGQAMLGQAAISTIFPLSVYGTGGSGTGFISSVTPSGFGPATGPHGLSIGGNWGYDETAAFLYNTFAASSMTQLFGAGAEGTYSNGGVASAYDYYIYDYQAGRYRLFVSSNGFVAIGSTAPATMLDVSGGAVVRSSLTLTGISAPPVTAAGQGAIYFDSAQNQLLASQNGSAYLPLGVWQGAGGSGVAYLSGGYNAVIASTLTVQGSAFSVNGTGLAFAGGKLGLGTGNPATALDVNGGATVRSSMTLVGIPTASQPPASAGGQGAIYFDSTLNQFQISQSGSGYGPLNVWQTAGSVTALPNTYNALVQSTLTVAGNAFSVGASTFVVNSGNVGVGTTAPATLLDINGSAQFGSGAARSTFTATPSNTTYALALSSGLSVAGTGGVTASFFSGAHFGNGAGLTGVTAGSLGGGLANEVPYQTGAGATTFTGQPGANMVLFANAGAPAWTNTPTLTGTNFSGVPAGTALVGAVNAYAVSFSTLEPNGGALSAAKTVAPGQIQAGPLAASIFPSTAAWSSVDDAWSAPQTFLAASTVTLKGNAFSVGGSTLVIASGQVGISSVPAAGVGFAVGPSSFVVLQNGNVGIGTTNPANALDVNGGAVVRSSFTVTGGGVTFWSRTIAQLVAITPASVGETYFCSNCVGAVGATGKIVVSTGTAAGQFADAAGGIFK